MNWHELVVLITGGTGSFGKKFIDIMLREYRPKKLIVFSRDELKQHELQQFYAARRESSLRFFIGDVRDRERLERAFRGVDVVVHAAALKQVPACEYNPFEAILTNVMGAKNIIDAALDQNVRKVLALSTDKAVNPLNLYGATKLCAEKLFVQGNTYAGGAGLRFSCVRYGNVVGSRGSVIPLFLEQKKEGRITITDPRMTRFWITLDQGARFVIRCIERMEGGEVFVPRIPSVNIMDLAKTIAPEAKIETIGIRPGEKLHEVLISEDEARDTVEWEDMFVVQPAHPWWTSAHWSIGKKVPEGFRYASDTNPHQLTGEELRQWAADFPLDRSSDKPPQPRSLPYARQSINEADITAVVSVMRSDWLTQGPVITQFERRVADYCGARYAVAVANGTAALHLSCLALGLKPGQRLWTSPNTFVASANCGLYCGAEVDFVDIDPQTYNLSVPELTRKLAQAAKKDRLPSVVVPVDFAGQSCQLEAIHELARQYRFAVLEDAAHAFGGRYQDAPVGNCRFSDLTIFSFHPVKIITTGEGGMVVTNREDLYQQLVRLRTHGITRDPRWLKGESAGGWYYEQIGLGFNYRLTDMQAALGLSQMERLDAFLSRRRYLAARYDQLLAELPVVTPTQDPQTESSWHLYVVRLKPGQNGKPHRDVFYELRQQGIGVNLHYIPVHTQPYYRQLGFRAGDYPEAEKYYAEAISLPLSYTLTDEDQNRVVDVLRQVL